MCWTFSCLTTLIISRIHVTDERLFFDNWDVFPINFLSYSIKGHTHLSAHQHFLECDHGAAGWKVQSNPY